jgi:outer membrane protein TolC
LRHSASAQIGIAVANRLPSFNLIQAQANRHADTAALFQALGGGWWNRADLAKN